MKAEDAVKLLPFYGDLSAEQRDLTLSGATIRLYGKGDFIHSMSDACLGMVYVLKGGIRVYLLSDEGREITLFRLEEGNPCVLSASCVVNQINFDTHMTAERDCELLVVNSATYKRLIEENIYVRCFTYELMTERFSSVMWAMQQILFSRFDKRLAAFLISEYDKTGNPEIRMTHEQIAQHVSSAREVVARMLKRFTADGLVVLKRGSIIIKDTDKLREIC